MWPIFYGSIGWVVIFCFSIYRLQSQLGSFGSIYDVHVHPIDRPSSRLGKLIQCRKQTKKNQLQNEIGWSELARTSIWRHFIYNTIFDMKTYVVRCMEVLHPHDGMNWQSLGWYNLSGISTLTVTNVVTTDRTHYVHSALEETLWLLQQDSAMIMNRIFIK